MLAHNNRHYTVIDKLIEQFDQSLRTLASAGLTTTRPNPADTIAEKPLTKQEQQHSAGLLRVDHTGEVCAQALYQGQALTAHTSQVREKMHQAAHWHYRHSRKHSHCPGAKIKYTAHP